jgi:hypothetical protein
MVYKQDFSHHHMMIKDYHVDKELLIVIILSNVFHQVIY